MKPIKLTMSAFGPYAGVTVIPFQKLCNQGLYLITGDTGAGKTTIFDGITYALYGESSGKSREVASMRSDFAAADAETYVELEFQFRGEHYFVRRSPDYERPSKRAKDKMVKAVATAELTCPDGNVVTGVTPVTRKIEELLGIDRNQFSQIVMIAQGDFLRLLHANTKERREIFRTIFNTDRYLQLQNVLRDEKNGLKSDYDDGVKGILQYAGQLVCGQEFPHREQFLALQTENNPYKVEELVELCQLACEEDDTVYGTISEQLSELHSALETLNQQLGQARQSADNAAKLESAQARVLTLEANQITLEWQYQEQAANAPKREKLYQEALRLEGTLQSYDELETAEQEALRYQNAVEASEKATATLERTISEDEKEQTALRIALMELETAPVQLEQKTASYGSISNRSRTLERLRQLYDDWQMAALEWADAHRKYEESQQKYDLEDQTRHEVEIRFLREQAGIMAAGLEEGTPCPVCGAVHHPKPAVCGAQAPTQDEVEIAKRNAADAREQAVSASQKVAAQEAKLSAARQICLQESATVLGECPETEISREIEIQLKLAKQQREELEQTIEALKQDCVRREALKGQQTALERRLVSARASFQQAKETKQSLELTRNSAISRRDMLRAGLEFQSKKDAMAAISENQSKYRQLDQALENARENRDTGRLLIQEVRAQITTLEQALQNTAPSLPEKLEQEKAKLEEKQAFLREKSSTLHERLTINRRLMQAIHSKQAELANLEHQYLMIENLSDTANGELKGKQRVAFESYMQAAYFDQVLCAANQRLQYMSSGRYELVRQKETTSLRGQSGLELNVMDHYTGKQRSVKTLSGGESFKASLSLALGLSDIVQQYAGGVEIDAMFVDEGFGSLDAESRQQAITILTGLTGGKRTVGIISHVAEFRESIDTQIIITKGTNGSTIQLMK